MAVYGVDAQTFSFHWHHLHGGLHQAHDSIYGLASPITSRENRGETLGMGALKNRPYITWALVGYIYIYISTFKGVLAALSVKKLMASLISQDSVVGKYSSGEYPREATPENCCSGFWCSSEDKFLFDLHCRPLSSAYALLLLLLLPLLIILIIIIIIIKTESTSKVNGTLIQKVTSACFYEPSSNKFSFHPPYQLSQMPAPSHENHWSHWPGTASPPTFQPETWSRHGSLPEHPSCWHSRKLTAGTKWSFGSDDVPFISEVIFWIQTFIRHFLHRNITFHPSPRYAGSFI